MASQSCRMFATIARKIRQINAKRMAEKKQKGGSKCNHTKPAVHRTNGDNDIIMNPSSWPDSYSGMHPSHRLRKKSWGQTNIEVEGDNFKEEKGDYVNDGVTVNSGDGGGDIGGGGEDTVGDGSGDIGGGDGGFFSDLSDGSDDLGGGYSNFSDGFDDFSGGFSD